MGKYQCPPITEAVIAISFEHGLSDQEQKTISRKLSSFYETELHRVHKNVQLEFQQNSSTPKVSSIDQEIIRRANNAHDEIFLAAGSNIIISQLAIYKGWNYFFERFKRDWQITKGVIGYKKIARVGLRYINRLDIPLVDGIAEYEKYVNIYPKIPSVLQPPNSLNVMVQKSFPDHNADVVVNAASVPSPLPGYGAFLIDIDVG